jgi:hypothetical protein
MGSPVVFATKKQLQENKAKTGPCLNYVRILAGGLAEARNKKPA